MMKRYLVGLMVMMGVASLASAQCATGGCGTASRFRAVFSFRGHQPTTAYYTPVVVSAPVVQAAPTKSMPMPMPMAKTAEAPPPLVTKTKTETTKVTVTQATAVCTTAGCATQAPFMNVLHTVATAPLHVAQAVGCHTARVGAKVVHVAFAPVRMVRGLVHCGCR